MTFSNWIHSGMNLASHDSLFISQTIRNVIIASGEQVIMFKFAGDMNLIFYISTNFVLKCDSVFQIYNHIHIIAL